MNPYPVDPLTVPEDSRDTETRDELRSGGVVLWIVVALAVLGVVAAVWWLR